MISPTASVEWVAPPELAQPLPRQTVFYRNYNAIILAIFLTALVLPAPFIISDVKQSRRMFLLQEHGIAIKGTVQKTYYQPIKYGRIYFANYSFKTLSESGNFQTWVEKCGLTREQFNSIRHGDDVTVIYLRDRPYVSACENNVHVFEDRPKQMFSLGVVVLIIYGSLISSLCLVIWSVYWKQVYLIRWGSVCEGVMAQQKLIQVNGTQLIKTYYQFTTISGRSVRLSRTSTLSSELASQHKVIILYRSTFPMISMIYPPSCARAVLH